MPLFEYVCRNCGKPFEKLVNGAPRIACPECASSDVEKKLSSFAVSKGSAAIPDCSAAGCGFERGGCGSGLCGHAH
jgi:putative FmdB family regulatory protein